MRALSQREYEWCVRHEKVKAKVSIWRCMIFSEIDFSLETSGGG
jgi:hypothetical protein